MKQFKAIFSIFFAMLVFASSTSFSVGVHRCMGRVKAVAFLDLADGCGHSKMPAAFRNMMKGCCEDDTISHDAQSFQADHVLVNFGAPVFIVVQDPLFVSEIVSFKELRNYNQALYHPPIRSADITILTQTFLI